jgi:hypothetical protein
MRYLKFLYDERKHIVHQNADQLFIILGEERAELEFLQFCDYAEASCNLISLGRSFAVMRSSRLRNDTIRVAASLYRSTSMGISPET